MSLRLTSALALALVAATASLSHAAPIGTVFYIALENHNATAPGAIASGFHENLYGNAAAPYLNSLITPGNPNAAQTSYATKYIDAGKGEHPSEPNYVWAEAGTDYNTYKTGSPFLINNDNDPNANNTFVNAPHLTQQMNAKGVTWKTYQEDYQITSASNPSGGSVLVSKSGTSTTVTNPYYNTRQYNYAAKHDPMAFFNDTATQNVADFNQLRSDLAANTASPSNPAPTNGFGQYNWITPNQYNDMHSALSTNFTYNGHVYTAGTEQNSIAVGDNFLSILVPQIMATEAYKNNGAIVIWTDETEPTSSADTNADDVNHTLAEIVISPLAKGNAYTNTIEYNHSSDIKTMEEIFQLGSYINNTLPPTQPYQGAAGLNAVPTSNDLSDLFVSGTIPTAVPEPSAFAFLAPASLLLARRRRVSR